MRPDIHIPVEGGAARLTVAATNQQKRLWYGFRDAVTYARIAEALMKQEPEVTVLIKSGR